MSVTYDLESLLTDVRGLIVAKFNAKVTAIEAEKIAVGAIAVTPTLLDTTNGLFEQTWSDKILNQDPAIFYGIEEAKAEGVGPATIETVKIWVEVVLVDRGDALTQFRVYRYARALKEIFEENWDKFLNATKIKIETVRPVSFRLDLNTSEEMKVGGISIITALA